MKYSHVLLMATVLILAGAAEIVDAQEPLLDDQEAVAAENEAPMP